MSILFRVLFTTVCLFFGGAAVAGAGQVVKAPANEDCFACHGDADAKRANWTRIAVEAPAFAASKHGPMACVDCHADLAALTE
jgi:nitrate/TMAO reductase-like tetraheme cytochrome c subunit